MNRPYRGLLANGRDKHVPPHADCSVPLTAWARWCIMEAFSAWKAFH